MNITHNFTIESLIETHDLPFLVINKQLQIVAVNTAWENHFGLSRDEQLGQPCCPDDIQCRHRRFFETMEGYTCSFTEATAKFNISNIGYKAQFRISGYPIHDADDNVFLGESISITQQLENNYPFAQMVGISPAFLKLQTKLEQAAKSNVPVLLTGETGTGKEVAAAFIHANSESITGDFIVVDCTLLTENLCESELFGHEKGAFTNAVTSKKGLFELANQGTLFLDEVGELPLSQQPKLLRALESGQFRRVGGTKALSSKVRVICATHRNLGDMVKAGTFREDLFYRLSVLPIEIPPLRDRKQDIPLLAEFMLRQDGHSHILTQNAVAKLSGHRWPGNIRELKNCMQLAIALATHSQIDKQEIHILRRRSRNVNVENLYSSNTIQNSPGESILLPQSNPSPPKKRDKTDEKDLIISLLEKHQGNRKLIAAEMQISERTLYRKLDLFKLS